MISVIIGTENSEHSLVPTLAALVAGAAAGIVRDVIVADAGSRDATSEIADLAGCTLIVSKAPLATRLNEAAERARASWLMFLPPGVVLDATWIDETRRFIETAELSGAPTRAANFRRAPAVVQSRPLVLEALMLLKSALGGRPHPEQGLLIPKHLYDQFGGHRGGAGNPQADLLARLGSKRILTLRSGAAKVAEN